MELRAAGEQDLEGLRKLLLQVNQIHADGRPDLFRAGGIKYTDQELLDILPDDGRPVFVCAENDQVLGYAFCILEDTPGTTSLQPVRTLYLDDLCVMEHARGRHIGRKLFEYVRDFARRKGCYNVTLHVWECNPGARAFYESLGLAPQYTSMELVL